MQNLLKKTAANLLKCGSYEKDVKKLAKNLGIAILYQDLGSMLGLYTSMVKVPMIILSDSLTDELERIVIAHEIAHHALHRKIVESPLFYEERLFSKDRLEREANAVAAHLLISDDDLLDALNFEPNIFYAAETLQVDPNLVIIKLSELNKMGYKFNIPCNAYDNFLRKYAPSRSEGI